ncbi:FimV/HubP family polar landmark protein [Psychrobacter pygoscelis]|uniref:FimV/HubP family polar landmark protein n=1 Tax=Psychrobacter pygoscelis TaxID=2488563 RepID=UPI0013F4001F|nr:FimV/HubP family polar landmark protein [Psychrobacter pygoscelis]
MNDLTYIIIGLAIILVIALIFLSKKKKPDAGRSSNLRSTERLEQQTSKSAAVPARQENLMIAQSFIDQQRYDDAIGVLKQGLITNPHNKDLSLKLLNIYAIRNNFDEFTSLYESIQQQGNADTLAEADKIKELIDAEQASMVTTESSAHSSHSQQSAVGDADYQEDALEFTLSDEPTVSSSESQDDSEIFELEEITAEDTAAPSSSTDSLSTDSNEFNIADFDVDGIEDLQTTETLEASQTSIDSEATTDTNALSFEEIENQLLADDPATASSTAAELSDADDFEFQIDDLADDSAPVTGFETDINSDTGVDTTTEANTSLDIETNDYQASDESAFTLDLEGSVAPVTADNTEHTSDLELDTAFSSETAELAFVELAEESPAADLSADLETDTFTDSAPTTEANTIELDDFELASNELSFDDSLVTASQEYEQDLPSGSVDTAQNEVSADASLSDALASDNTLDDSHDDNVFAEHSLEADTLETNNLEADDLETDSFQVDNLETSTPSDELSSSNVLGANVEDTISQLDALSFSTDDFSLSDDSASVETSATAPDSPASDLSNVADETMPVTALDDSQFEEDFEFVNELDASQVTLDLASQYLELGEYESAKRLLNEVVAQGNAEQQAEAQSLLAKTV